MRLSARWWSIAAWAFNSSFNFLAALDAIVSEEIPFCPNSSTPMMVLSVFVHRVNEEPEESVFTYFVFIFVM